MHRPIKDHLEEFLRGTGDRGVLSEFEAHLEACDDCLQEVQQMRQHAQLLKSTLKLPVAQAPQPDFFARVMKRVEAQPKPSFWSVFLDPVFGKRLIYATATILVLLSTYLVSSEANQPYAAASSSVPEVILADQDHAPRVDSSQQQQRDAILVNLATYQE